ncbi:MAG TPA: type III-B CRISPR module RAMP protein Cmr4 [Acetobacteraceae bacterium]|nr:type III-B CRISPR module RAMP protein Cmr4 [Acetobacteraceae bacterium]
MTPRPYILHALSPLHAGVGQAAELIDLPIARLKGTGIPYVPGSSIKGVLRDDCKTAGTDKDVLEAVFGPDFNNAGAHAGALICTDARLLALPVRSFVGTFAFVTSPLLLGLAARDINQPLAAPTVTNGKCMAAAALAGANNTVYLEDLDLQRTDPNAEFNSWLAKIATIFGTGQAVFKPRLAVVDDETMTFLWETATQLDQRVRIDSDTRTVANGALWLEESLPPETLLIGQLLAEPSRKPGTNLIPVQVLDQVLKAERPGLQFGGKSTVGRGRCRMVPLP